jgi:DNA-binding MarR family transcriptional regulator
MTPGKARRSRGLRGEAGRTGNLLGAAALAIAGATEESTGPRSQAANAALAILRQWPPRSIGNLSKVLQRSHSASVRLVEELQAEGLVTKHAGLDRRSIVVKLTGAGRREAEAILAQRAKVLDGVVSTLAPADQRDLARILEKILTSLTPDRETCDHICRLCHIAACPQDRCPVELAVRTIR